MLTNTTGLRHKKLIILAISAITVITLLFMFFRKDSKVILQASGITNQTNTPGPFHSPKKNEVSMRVWIVSNEEILLNKYSFIDTRTMKVLYLDSTSYLYHTGGHNHIFYVAKRKNRYFWQVYRDRKFVAAISFHSDSNNVRIDVKDKGRSIKIEYSNQEIRLR